MTTAPTPAKLKACLANIKETALLPDDDSTQNDANSLYETLLFTELVQRGVVVRPSDYHGILNAVISTAGRSLLHNNIPNPLLAASAAVSGMVAEQCYEFSNVELNQDDKYYISAMERCREVEDDRLAALLQLPFQKDEIRMNLLILAEGQYLRAASFQPDPPQMWKRTLDVVVKRNPSNNNNDAALPLQQLIRVAKQKGNMKRVSELSLRLAESILSTEIRTQKSPLQEQLQKAFVFPYRPKEKANLAKRADCAREALTECNVSLLGDAVLRYNTVALGIEVASESACIQQLAEEQYTADKNRSQEGGRSISTSTSLDSFIQSAQTQVLTMQSEGTNVVVDEKAILLRDSVLSTLKSSKGIQTDALMSRAMVMVGQQVKRLEDRARSIALDVQQGSKSTCTHKDAMWAWSTVSDFVKPILARVQDQCGAEEQGENSGVASFLKIMPLVGRDMVVSAAMACVSVVWNTAENGLDFCLQILSSSLESAKTEKEERRRLSEDIVKSLANEKDTTILQLECAHASAMCLVTMAKMGDNNDGLSGQLLQDVTEQAIVMSNTADRYDEADKFGTEFLQCLVCWSGLYRSPWPFCNVTQARAIVRRARQGLKQCTIKWGRSILFMESMLLDLAEADSEGGLLVGGFVHQAGTLYKQVLSQLAECQEDDSTHLDLVSQGLLKTHCLNGLARIALQGDVAASLSDQENTKSGSDLAETLARDSLKDLEQLRSSELSSLYLWASPLASSASSLFYVSVARQLVADSLLRASRPSDAQCFLEDAVRDAPLDFDAALALGAFRLRMVFFCEGDGAQPPSAADEKEAQTQLLKAAKLDSTKADPFALLGLWYEKRGDAKRAVGCYSKALLLEPPHPVAGRGILRLKPFDDVKSVCDAASNTNSPLNGWAWRALGQSKAMVHGDDDLAIVCFQKAIRCRDVECPRNESLGIFYPRPPRTFEAAHFTSDLGDAWAELAGCYRRLGRYTAAVRAFESANEAVGDSLPSAVLCSWAQVELELGLHEEAAEKFATVLSRSDVLSYPVAAYGQGSALLALAHMDAQDGKGGRAFEHLKRAIDGLECLLVHKQTDDSLSSPFICALKLLGDLYSFGARLPPDVFLEENVGDESQDDSAKCMIRSQISFVAVGEDAYCAALEAHEKQVADEVGVLKAPYICDHGTNKLLQAQMLASLHGEGGGSNHGSCIAEVIRRVPEVREMFDNASKTFLRAIQVDPLYPPAWCGLGCAVCGVDPLLSQHSFCRALQLDKTSSPDFWANLGFLYAAHDSITASAFMMEALTKVADSPMMWIGRALLLERTAFSTDDLNNEAVAEGSTEELVSRAADAYRAALQVVKHPSALLGLSLTCRMTPTLQRSNEFGEVSQQKARVESSTYMSEFLDATGGANAGASALGGAMTMEDWIQTYIKNGVSWSSKNAKSDPSVSAGEGVDAQHSSTEDNGIKTDMLQNLSMHVVEDSPALDNSGQEEKKESISHFSHELSISRQIVHDPDNGQLWLHLAKNLASELASVSSDGSPKRKIVRSTLESAMLAADRSAKLLTEQLVNPKKLAPTRHLHEDSSSQARAQSLAQSAVPKVVDAEDVSDALSLAYWVAKAGSEIFEDFVFSNERRFDLQRALIMCPSNKFARETLTMACKDKDNSGSEAL